MRQRWQPPLRPPQIRRMQLAVARALGKLRRWRSLWHLQLLQALLHPGQGFENFLRLGRGQQGSRSLLPVLVLWKLMDACLWPVLHQCVVVLSVQLLRPRLVVLVRYIFSLSVPRERQLSLMCDGFSISIPREVLGDLVKAEAVCRASILTCSSHLLGGRNRGMTLSLCLLVIAVV